MYHLCLKEKELYSAKCLIKKLDISDKYLRKIMTMLSKGGFVNSFRGRYGGYVFAKAPESIYIIDIINTVEGIERYGDCLLGFSECSDENPCAMHEQWSKIRNHIIDMYKNTSLANLAEAKINKY